MKNVITAFLISILAFGLSGCQNGNDFESGDKENIVATYEQLGIVLTGDDFLALVDIGENTPLLLIADGTFDDGYNNHAAIRCSVYYAEEETLYALGTLESPKSEGTAYSIRTENNFLYTASNSSIEQYKFDADSHTLVLYVQYLIIYDLNGEETYYRIENGSEEVIAESDFVEATSMYESASIVDFA